MPGGDDDPIGRRESDVAMALVAHQIKELEKAVVRLGTQIDNLRFVPQNVYDANQETANQIHQTLANALRDTENRLAREIADARASAKDDVAQARKQSKEENGTTMRIAIVGLSAISVALLGGLVLGIMQLAGL